MTRARRPSALIRTGLLLLVAAGSQGCRWGGRDAKVEEIPVLHGISVVEFDGLNLLVKRSADEADGLTLMVGKREVEQVELRVGDRFVLTNGRDVHEAYQLLVVSDQRATFKKQEVFDRRATRDGTRTVESVIAVTPYDLEDTE